MEHKVPSLLQHTSAQHARHLFLKDLRRFFKQRSNLKVKQPCQNKMKNKKWYITGVLISSNCSRIRFLLKRHKKNVTTFCSRVFSNRYVTLKLWRWNKNCILMQLDDMAMPVKLKLEKSWFGKVKILKISDVVLSLRSTEERYIFSWLTQYENGSKGDTFLKISPFK